MKSLGKSGLELLWSHIASKLSTKVDKVSGKGLSTNDYTDEDKNKVANMVGATVDSELSATSTNSVQNKVIYQEIFELNEAVVNILDIMPDKQDAITGAATTVVDNDLSAGRALISNDAGKIAISEVTNDELVCLEGVTSNIQEQLDSKLSSASFSYDAATQTLSITI